LGKILRKIKEKHRSPLSDKVEEDKMKRIIEIQGEAWKKGNVAMEDWKESKKKFFEDNFGAYVKITPDWAKKELEKENKRKYDLNPGHYWKYWPENEKKEFKKEQY
jgi:hypothetical protein